MSLPMSKAKPLLSPVCERQEGVAVVVAETDSEGDYYVGRTQYDSPEVDDEILITADSPLQIGYFYPVRITQADYFDCYGVVEAGV